MKIVINRCIGGFGVSTKAAIMCMERGMSSSYFDKIEREHEDAYFVNPLDKSFRIDPTFVSVVEELGEEANGKYANLEIFDVPFNSTKGWHLCEAETGYEWIEEAHRCWPEKDWINDE